MSSRWLCAVLAVAAASGAETSPRPPCGGEPFPAYPAAGVPPVVQIWDHLDWAPPSCTGWQPAASSTVIATAGRFRNTGGSEVLRRRIGAISKLTGLPYWSTTNQRWQPLIVEAYALSDADDTRRREDLSADEVSEGREFYLHQEDNLLGKAVYRGRVLKSTVSRLIFATENTTAIKYLAIPVFQPGEVQSIVFLERETKDVWRYYSMARLGKAASLLMAGHSASFINRAVASYRYLAGMPADKEPPAAR